MTDRTEGRPPPGRTLRVLLVAFSRSSLGHVTRTTAAAQHLADAGHEVLLACHPSASAVPEAAGVPWVGIDEIAPAPAWRGLDDPEQLRAFARARLASPAYVESCLAEELALVDSWQPDVVLADMRSTAGVAASLRGLPSASIQNLRLFAHPLHVVLPEVVATLGDLGIEPEHARRVLGNVLLVPDVPVLDRLCDLPPEAAAVVTGAVDGVQHVGPLVTCDVLGAATAPREPPPTSDGGPHAPGPHVVVTLGGSGAGLADLAALVPALLAGGCSVHALLGSGTDAEARDTLADATGPLPAGASSALTVSGFRGDSVRLVRAADVAVVHGGHSSMLEGLLCATPLVLLPHSPEQRGNAARVEQLALGRVVRREDPPARFVGAVVAAVASRATGRPEAFARHLRTVADGAALVEAVERLAEVHRAMGPRRTPVVGAEVGR